MSSKASEKILAAHRASYGRDMIRNLRIEGRCFTCLMREELYPATHPESGSRIYLCEYCKLDQELKEAFEQSIFSPRSALSAS
jgi:hypothetical protein